MSEFAFRVRGVAEPETFCGGKGEIARSQTRPSHKPPHLNSTHVQLETSPQLLLFLFRKKKGERGRERDVKGTNPGSFTVKRSRIMPRKRSAESEAPEPVPKRRSARQAGKNAGPAAARSETEIPKSAGKKGATGKGAGSNGANEAGQDAPDAPRHVVKGKAAAKPVKQKTTKSTAPKSEKVAGPAESARGARDVSEDPDIDSIPTRNPEVERHEGEWYWLMKAEPESRLENGIDVKFSIDDLRAREAPEPWDGR